MICLPLFYCQAQVRFRNGTGPLHVLLAQLWLKFICSQLRPGVSVFHRAVPCSGVWCLPRTILPSRSFPVALVSAFQDRSPAQALGCDPSGRAIQCVMFAGAANMILHLSVCVFVVYMPFSHSCSQVWKTRPHTQSFSYVLQSHRTCLTHFS
jgi:hypothetical protein